jgi:hypothetical protein
MQNLTSADATAWCDQRGIRTDFDLGFSYGALPKRRLDVTPPNGVPGLLYAARSLARLETRGLYPSNEKYEREFAGCLLWVTKHDAWSHATEQVGMHVFSQLGARTIPDAKNEATTASLDTYPARYFGPNDLVAAEASILQPLLFQWAAYVIPESGNFIASICHDGTIRGIIAREPDFLNSVKGVFSQMDIREAIPAADTIQITK